MDTKPEICHAVVTEGVLTREVDGELVILDMNAERYLGLDEVGVRFWEALTTAPTLGEAARSLEGGYEVAPERLRRDFEALLSDLVAHGLVTVLSGRRPSP